MVAMELETKSRPGPIDSLFRSNTGTESTKSDIFCRMDSKTAKLNAPCGNDNMKFAPAPRVSRRNICGFIKLTREGLLGPKEDCMMVFMVFAGCITVCAILLEIAPLTMLSQNNRGRVATNAGAVAEPPRGVSLSFLLFASVDLLLTTRFAFITEDVSNDEDEDDVCLCFKCGFIVNVISFASSE